MDLSTIKNISPNRHLFRKIIAIVLSIFVFIGSFIIITNSNKDAKNTIEVLRVKTKGGLEAFAVISQNDIEKYALVKKEYTSDMLLVADMPKVINKLIKYYLRNNAILYKDQIVDNKPKKNEWLYNLGEDQEVLTIPYNYLECGGDVLLPGDSVRIRVSYEVEEESNTNNLELYNNNPNIVFAQSKGKLIKTDILFDNIVVKDMINSSSHSIYEVYKEVMKLNEDKKEEVMKSDEFLRSIQPKALLLAGTKEEMTNYAKFKSSDPKAFLITILSRSSSQVILDQLPTLKNEVESWIEKKKNQ